MKKRRWTIWLVPFLMASAALIGILLYRRRRAYRRWRVPRPDLVEIQGLSEAEAAARQTEDPVQERRRAMRQVRRGIWRDNILSIFVLDMVGLTVANWLLGAPLSALMSFGILCLNVGINVGQELLAVRWIERVLERARPLATVIRDGQVKSIIQDKVVVGDALVIGPGDQILADGQVRSSTDLLTSKSAFASQEQATSQRVGDSLSAGGYCVRGWAVYEVEALPRGGLGVTSFRVSPGTPGQKTPLQRIVDRVLRGMLGLVALFLGLLVLDLVGWGKGVTDSVLYVYRDWVGLIFSIAPGSLFLMITVAYTVGATILGNAGAAVRNAQVVESLAQVTVLCFGRPSMLRGADVEIEMMSSPSGYPGLAENRVRQLLGAYARSTRGNNTYLRALARVFGGEGRIVERESPYLSAFGWSGITFSEPDIRGTYILGDPDLLNDQLTSSDRPHEVEPVAALPFLQRAWDRGTSWIKRMTGSERTEASQGHETEPGASRPPEKTMLASESDEVKLGAEPGALGLWERFRTQLRGVFERLEDMLGTEEAQPEVPPDTQRRLLFAHSPGPQALFDADGWPQMPSDLVPLCTLTFNDQVRPEARQAVRAFTDAGVQVKLFTTDAPEAALATAGQLGIGEERLEPGQVVSGAELTGTGEGAFAQFAQRGTIFASTTPEQKAELVRALRSQGEHVALVGDSAYDVPAMHQANVSIAFRSSGQAVLGAADIVLLEDSLQVLPTVLAEGQRIVNSLLNTLKLNLTQVSYLLLLQIVALVIGRYMFFYQPRHAGLVSLFTLTLPGLALPFWSAAVAVPRTSLRPQLVHFVLPSALTVTAAVLAIDYLFLRAGADVTYTQLAVALALIAMGLTLFVSVQPSLQELVGGNVPSGNWRFIWLAIGLFIAYLVLSSLPLAQELLGMGLLSRAADYAVVGLVVLLWALALRAIWRTHLLNRFVDIVTSSEGESRIATVRRKA